MAHTYRLLLFLPALTFYEIYYLPIYRLPTLLSATEEGFKAL